MEIRQETADLEVRLTYPVDADGTSGARLMLRDRKSAYVIAELTLTAEDVVDLFASRVEGPLRGVATLLDGRNRQVLNMHRILVTVRLPFAVDVFMEGHPLQLEPWASGARQAFGAHDYRITRGKCGYTVDFMFFRSEWTDGDCEYVEILQGRLQEEGRIYAEKATERKARQ